MKPHAKASSTRIRSFTLFVFGALAILSCGCRAPVNDHADGSARKRIELAVLGHLVANADQTASLVRFVDLAPADLEKFRTTCGDRFEIFNTDMADRGGGILHLKDSSREGVHLVATVTEIRGRDAEAFGVYMHVGGFASFAYKLRYDEGGWKIVSCEFRAAS
jgi:hypothetical protein